MELPETSLGRASVYGFFFIDFLLIEPHSHLIMLVRHYLGVCCETIRVQVRGMRVDRAATATKVNVPTPNQLPCRFDAHG
jgi:hypothetical protein